MDSTSCLLRLLECWRVRDSATVHNAIKPNRRYIRFVHLVWMMRFTCSRKTNALMSFASGHQVEYLKYVSAGSTPIGFMR